MAQITTLLFDIGDVLVDNNWQRSFQKLCGHMKADDDRALTIEEITEKLHPAANGSAWNDFGINRINYSQFLDIILSQTGYTGERKLLENALMQISEPLPERIVLLNKLIACGKYIVALVSDTNALHMDHLEEYIPDIFINLPVEKRFYSHRIGFQKKDGKEIYNHVLNALSIKPENALMIDDRIQNKAGADEIGLNFLLIQKEDDLEAILRTKSYDLIF